ncbi:MAG: glycosyltransferase, partial [Methanosarcinales archaeon]
MKIVFFTDTYTPQVNGVVTSIKLFSEQLRKRHKVYIVCPYDKKLRKEKNVYALRSFSFRPYPEYRIGLPSLKVLRIIRKIRPDIIHLQSPASIGLIGLSIAKFLKIPIVMTYHTFLTDYVHYLTKRKFLKKINKRAIRKYTKWFFNRADIITVPSNPIKKLLKSYGIRKPIKVLPTGLKLEEFNIKVKKKNKVPVILHVGRITKEKRIDVILREFKKLLKKIDAKL